MAQPLAVPVICLMAAAGCGDPLATGSFKPPYVTIAGRIATAPASTPPDVRVALLWQNDQSPGSNYAEQLLTVHADFPANFALDIAELPQANVVHSVPADVPPSSSIDRSMRWAFGTLIVYADDGNGRFDITAPGGRSPDRVLGAANDLDLFYLANGRPAPSELIGIFPVSSGFSLVREPMRRDPRPGECGHFDGQGHFSDLCSLVTDALPQPLDAGATIDLTLSDDATLGFDRFGCSTFWGPLEYPDWLNAQPGEVCDGPDCKYCRGYQCPLDLPPAGVAAQCSPDKLAYVYKTCVDDASLCGTRFCHFGHGERRAEDPIPAAWPCP